MVDLNYAITGEEFTSNVFTSRSSDVISDCSSDIVELVLNTEKIIAGTLNNPKKQEGKDEELINKYENDPKFLIKRVKEIVPNRVFEFTLKGRGYSEEGIIKTVCDSEDEPNLEYACALAIAKYYYNFYTLEAIINHIIPFYVFGDKNNLKEIKHGVKIIEENRRIAQIKKEKEEIKARQKKKRAEQKRRRAEKRKNNQINIIKEAILASKQ